LSGHGVVGGVGVADGHSPAPAGQGRVGAAHTGPQSSLHNVQRPGDAEVLHGHPCIHGGKVLAQSCQHFLVEAGRILRIGPPHHRFERPAGDGLEVERRALPVHGVHRRVEELSDAGNDMNSIAHALQRGDAAVLGGAQDARGRVQRRPLWNQREQIGQATAPGGDHHQIMLGRQLRDRRRGHRPEARLSTAPQIVFQQPGLVHAMVYVEAGRLHLTAEAKRLRPANRDDDMRSQDFGDVPVIDPQSRLPGASIAKMGGRGRQA